MRKLINNSFIILLATVIVYIVTMSPVYLIISSFNGEFISIVSTLIHPLSSIWFLYILFFMIKDEIKESRKVNS